MENKKDVLVIGAGIVGACCAYYLCEMGFEVTVIDQGDIASGCSKENAGLIVPSLIVPLASPAALKYGMKTFLNPDSPFYIKPRLNIGMISWIGKFLKASTPRKVERNLRVLNTLNQHSKSLFEDIIRQENISCDFLPGGWLKVYQSDHGMEDGLKEAELLKDQGIDYQFLTHNEVLKKEPLLSPDVIGGILFPGDAHLDPEHFTRQLSQRLVQKGVVFKTDTQVLDFEVKNRSIIKVITNNGNFQASQIILAAGAWSVKLAEKLGRNLFVEPGKGYSFILENFSHQLPLPLYLSEGKVAVTPLSRGVRLAGTMELGGFNENVNQRRVDAIMNTARKYLQLPEDVAIGMTWSGFRPCTPDGLPIIEKDRYYKNLITATGHCMLGVTQAPVTGWHVARLANNKQPDIILHMLKSSRL
jgi:D-amino-acid dehydrogenase